MMLGNAKILMALFFMMGFFPGVSVFATTVNQSSQDAQLLTARWTGLLTGVDNPGPQTGEARPVNLAQCAFTPAPLTAGARLYDCTQAYELMKKRPGVVGSDFMIDTLTWIAVPGPAGWTQSTSAYQGSYEFEVVVRKGAIDTAVNLFFVEQQVSTLSDGNVLRMTVPTKIFPLGNGPSNLVPEKTVVLSDGTPAQLYRFLMAGLSYDSTGKRSVGLEIKVAVQYVGKDGVVYYNYDSFPSATANYRIDLNYPLDRSQSILRQ